VAHRTQSRAMAFFRRLGLDRIAWSLRRLHCPVERDALVLEVGSGGNPYYRANVLLDAFEDTRQRHWTKLVADRPTVIGIVENLPFRDKAFDFVIASHVLEHSAHPARFLTELERVAKAGYIEVPDALMERLNPYMDHRLEITVRDSRLVIRKKRGWRQDEELAELYEHRAAPVIGQRTIPRHPFEFHVRYYWQNSIPHVVVNPQVDAGWPAPPAPDQPLNRSVRGALQGAVLGVLRLFLSQRGRNRNIDLVALLRCPACHAESMKASGTTIRCEGCGERYEITDGIPRLARN
jgi:SAM-dependent methyltransferase